MNLYQAYAGLDVKDKIPFEFVVAYTLARNYGVRFGTAYKFNEFIGKKNAFAKVGGSYYKRTPETVDDLLCITMEQFQSRTIQFDLKPWLDMVFMQDAPVLYRAIDEISNGNFHKFDFAPLNAVSYIEVFDEL